MCVCVYTHTHTHTHTQNADMHARTYKHLYIQNVKYIKYTLCAVVHYVHTHTHTHTHTIYQHTNFPLKFITFSHNSYMKFGQLSGS